jgi:hypothetical protein
MVFPGHRLARSPWLSWPKATAPSDDPVRMWKSSLRGDAAKAILRPVRNISFF